MNINRCKVKTTLEASTTQTETSTTAEAPTTTTEEPTVTVGYMPWTTVKTPTRSTTQKVTDPPLEI